MDRTDEFSDYYADLLDGTYDCVDRIVLNAYFSLGCTGGGMRMWWIRLHGSEARLDTTHLMRMAGNFSRRVQAFAAAHKVPLIFCKRGERKHELAVQYRPTDSNFTGLFLILGSRAPGARWQVSRMKTGSPHLQRARPWPYVRHFTFHIIDRQWGHVAIKISAHPPFGAQIALNGHDWVERLARTRGIELTKEENCFTDIADAQALAQIAEALDSPESIEQLAEVCDRWIYSTCLCLALRSDDQERSGFRYTYSVYQLEYSRNLLFQRGRDLDRIYQGLIDRTRRCLDLKTVKTLFGCRRRPTLRRNGKGGVRFHITVERPTYDLTVWKIHFKRLTLKIYDKGARVLRIEAIAHNTKDLRCGTLLGQFAVLVKRLAAMVYRFLNVLHCVDAAFLDAGDLDALPTPSRVGQRRLAGVDLDKPRMRAAVEAVIALSVQPGGFCVADLAAKVRLMTGWNEREYGNRQASYDLQKIRGKQIVERLSHSRRYVHNAKGLQTVCALLTLREKVIKPVVTSVGQSRRGKRPPRPGTIDHHYENLRKEMRCTFKTLGIAA